MRQITTSVRVPAWLLVCSALLTACGGGSGSGADGSTATAQTITFTNPGAQVTGTKVALAPTASSGFGVALKSNTSSVCTISRATVKLWAAGTCSITANQSGGSGYAPATSVTHTFAVTGTSTVLFLSGFEANGTTIEKGGYSGYAGSDLDGWWCATDWCSSGGSYSPTVIDDDSNFYFYYSPTSKPGGSYVGMSLYAPGVTSVSTTANTSGVQVTNQTAMKLTLAQNTEWFSTGKNGINITLVLGTRVNSCNMELVGAFTPTAAETTAYSVPLSSFKVNKDKDCGQTGDAASALASYPISQIKVDAQTANKDVPDSSSSYPTRITLTGSITFQ